MTGQEFERYFCEWLKHTGWWALNIPRASGGQQPFDVIAVKNGNVLAVDCKVVGVGSRLLPLNRIEDNQWLAFWSLRKRSEQAVIGVAVWHEKDHRMYFVDYSELVAATKAKQSSIPLVNKEASRIELLCKATLV